MQKWIALGEFVLANLAWIDELDLEGWLIGTAVAAEVAGAAGGGVDLRDVGAAVRAGAGDVSLAPRSTW